MGTYGGWVATTTYANGRTLVQSTDMFGRVVASTDLGGNTTAATWDLAGRMASRTVTDAGTSATEASSYAWLSNGLIGVVSTVLDGVTNVQTSAYDAGGNKLIETATKGGTNIQDATATYDALGRLETWAEAGNSTTPAASMAYEYDAASNVRRTGATFSYLSSSGAAGAAGTWQDHWYAYDAMNRMTIAEGMFTGTRGSGTIARGSGAAIAHNAAGERVQVSTLSNALEWSGWRATVPGGGAVVYADNPEDFDWDGYHWVNTGHATYSGTVVETYGYTADGLLDTVSVASEQARADGGLSVTANGTMGSAVTRAAYTYDSQNRLASQTDYEQNGTTVAYSRTSIAYNASNQIASEAQSVRQGADTIVSYLTNTYGSGSGYALGSVVTVSAGTWKNGSDSAAPDTLTTNSYAWRSGAVLSDIAYKPDTALSTTYTTAHALSPTGQVTSATITDTRARTVTYTQDALGQTIRRDEADSLSTGDPHQIWYRFAGRELGNIGNDGSWYADYASSVADRQTASGAGPFRLGAATGSVHAMFGEAYSGITSLYQGSATGGYTAQGGESLSSVAANLWGDSALWYKLAEANGLGGDATLTAGQRLTIPQGVIRSSNTATTFKPYDPAEALGSTSPTGGAPAKGKSNKCGGLGQLLVMAVSIAATLALPGGGGILGGALNGALGSTAGQVFGVATGIQDKINFGAIAMGGIAGGVGGALGPGGLSEAGVFSKAGGKFAQGALSGAVGSVATQGIGIALGLQSKFDFAGVAAAGLSGGIGRELGGGNFGERLGARTASGLAAAAARSILTGTDFGDNILAVLPDIIGQTIGGLTHRQVARASGGSSEIEQYGSTGDYADEIVVTARPQWAGAFLSGLNYPGVNPTRMAESRNRQGAAASQNPLDRLLNPYRLFTGGRNPVRQIDAILSAGTEGSMSFAEFGSAYGGDLRTYYSTDGRGGLGNNIASQARYLLGEIHDSDGIDALAVIAQLERVATAMPSMPELADIAQNLSVLQAQYATEHPWENAMWAMGMAGSSAVDTMFGQPARLAGDVATGRVNVLGAAGEVRDYVAGAFSGRNNVVSDATAWSGRAKTAAAQYKNDVVRRYNANGYSAVATDAGAAFGTVASIFGPGVVGRLGSGGRAVAAKGASQSPAIERYLAGSGGRLGGTSTRVLNDGLATELESQGYRVTGGAGRGAEEWFAGPGGGTRGGTFVDMTASNGTSTFRIQTVDTLADGITLTRNEAAAAARIRARFPNDELRLIPKPKR